MKRKRQRRPRQCHAAITSVSGDDGQVRARSEEREFFVDRSDSILYDALCAVVPHMDGYDRY